MTRVGVRHAFALGLCAFVGGCAWLPQPPRAMPVNHYLADARDLDTVRRILVLPFDESSGVRGDRVRVREAFVRELAKIQRFEIVPLPGGAEEDRRLYESLVRGRLSPETVVLLGQRYQVDGLLLGTITAYRAYMPTHLGLRVRLVSVHSGSTVWAAEGLYDAADAATIEDLEHYARSAAAEEASFHGGDITLIAPSKFAGYVAQRLVRTWRGVR